MIAKIIDGVSHSLGVSVVKRLTAIYTMLKKSEPYNPNLYKKEDAIPANHTISIEQAIAAVKRLGYIVVDQDGVVA